MQAAARQDVERRRLLGDLDRMVELGHAHHDAVADLDALGDHGAGGQEQFGCRAVRVFFEEMMLDRPHVIEAQLVGELHLLEAVVVDGALLFRRPRTRDRDLVEQAELHRQPPVILGETLGLPLRRRNSTMRPEGEME
jgi:hypothetical protein